MRPRTHHMNPILGALNAGRERLPSGSFVCTFLRAVFPPMVIQGLMISTHLNHKSARLSNDVTFRASYLLDLESLPWFTYFFDAKFVLPQETGWVSHLPK